MLHRVGRYCLAASLVSVCFLSQTRPVLAQLNFLRGLFTERSQAPQTAAFRGHQQLQQAIQAAANGDIPESLKLAREAFQDRGGKELFNDFDAQVVGPTLMQLLKLWNEKGAPAVDVAEILRDVVVPGKPAARVFAFPVQTQLSYDMNILNRAESRLIAPESVGAELIRWSVLAKQTAELKQRLQPALDAGPSQEAPKAESTSKRSDQKPPAPAAAAKLDLLSARVIAVQLAIAERDADAANEQLQELIGNVRGAPEQQLDYLCHAVSAGLHDAQSERSALALLEAIADRSSSLAADSAFRMNSSWLLVRAAELHARAGRGDDAKRCATAALTKPLDAQRFGAGYGAYLSRVRNQQVAGALLTVGAIEDAINVATMDIDPRANGYGPAGNTFNLAVQTARELRKLAPAERYEFLRKWALPGGDRTAVRSVVELISPELSPNLGSGLLLDVYSTSWELVATARELGKLDDLIRELGTIAAPSASVRSLLTLALVMRDGSANRATGTGLTNAVPTTIAESEVPARLTDLLAVTTKDVPPWELANKPQPPLDTYVIAVEAALHPEWRQLAQELMKPLIEHAQRTQAARIRDHFRMALIELMRLQTTGGPATPHLVGELSGQRLDGRSSPIHTDWLKLRPKMWDVINFATAGERVMGALPPTWFAQEGYLSHVSNGAESDLCFTVPLTGSFELSAECREGGWTEGLTGYGGVSTQIYAYNDAVYITGKGGAGYENSPKMTNLLHRTPWNRYTIRVDGDTVRHFANGQMILEDRPGTAAPWLTLGGKVGFTPTYRNLRIAGSPTIPREVKLLDDGRLRGWVASYFGESKPDALRNRRYIQVKVTQNNQNYSTMVEDDGTMEGEPVELNQSAADWTVVDGELRSARRTSFWGGASPSWLSYQRPLGDGEAVNYEFFHEQGKTNSYPTFGDVVYALGETGKDSDKHATPTTDRAALERRACAGDLKEGWNTIALSLGGGSIAIELNGREVVAENIVATNSRRIGFFHDAGESDLRVRNVVLTGGWPTSIGEVRAAIESPVPTETRPNSRFLTHVVGENYYSDNAYEIYRRAVRLEAPERFQFLRRWVLPNESSDLVRTSGAFTPTHPAPPALNDHPIDVATTEARQAVDARCVQAGGNFVCPAILLALTAAELDQLTELKNQVTAYGAASSFDMARNRAAMLGMIALLEDNTTEAIQWVREVQAVAVQHKDAAMYSRWGDLALASLAIQHPVTRDAAFELLTSIQSTQLQAGNQGTPEFMRFVRQLHGECVYLMYGGALEEFGTQPKTAQWRTVSQPRARSRGTGYPIASFDVVAGEMAQRGGYDFDAAYFQSPLRGNYEVSCRLSNFDWREAMLMGAGIANALHSAHDKVRVTHAMKMVQEMPLKQLVAPRVFQWSDYKIVVKGGRFTSFINGQKLYEEELPTEHDPWLAVVGWAGQSSRAVRDIAISGQPVIPEELDLLGSPDLRGWMTDYFAAEWGQTPSPWKLAGGELTSPQAVDANPLRDRRKVENVIRYHRPMLEDGEISYEFYFDPEVNLALPASNQLSYLGPNAPKRSVKGRMLVHPALDRMVCLMEPDGVKIHWLTDSLWDRTGLKADNVETLEASKPLPLKPRDWNAVSFRTRGDVLTIELNGETVMTREIEPTNLRHFGLFHYANESEARVRNIRYRGDWPKQLPAAAHQDLARGPLALASIPDAELPDSMTWDFTKSKFNREEFRWIWDSNSEKYIAPTDAGLRYSMPAGETKPQVAGIAPKIRISGDFMVTMEYENLKTVAGVENWGSGIGFNVALNGSYQVGIELREWAKSSAKVTNASQTIYVSTRPHLFLNEAINEFAPAGRLRIQRKGEVIYYLIAAAGSENFRLLAQRPLGRHDIVRIAINADASDKASGAEFVVKNLLVRAGKIVNGG